jgi:hypothetical protein
MGCHAHSGVYFRIVGTRKERLLEDRATAAPFRGRQPLREQPTRNRTGGMRISRAVGLAPPEAAGARSGEAWGTATCDRGASRCRAFAGEERDPANWPDLLAGANSSPSESAGPDIAAILD